MKASFGHKESQQEALQLLARAKAASDMMLKKEQTDGGMSDSTKNLAAEIHAMIAHLAAKGNDLDNAIKFYGKAATFLPNSTKANEYKLRLGTVQATIRVP